MIPLEPILAVAFASMASILLFLSVWEAEAGRHWHGRISEWQHRRVLLTAHLAQEVRLSAWLFLGSLIWLQTVVAPDPALGPHHEHRPVLWIGLLFGLVLIPLGWGFGRRMAFPSRLRFGLAPIHGLSMWVLWLLGTVRDRRRRGADRKATPEAAKSGPESPRAGVFELATIPLEEVMIPRSQVAALEGGRSVREALREVRRVPHALYPVYGDSVDSPLGVLRILDLAAARDLDRPVRELVRPAKIVPETMKGLSLLQDLGSTAIPAALVVDEFGGMAGFVTVEDLVEVLLGDLVGEHDVVRARILAQDPTRYRVEGTCRVEEFNAQFGPIIPEGEYETVAGFFLDRLGTIPAVGEWLQLDRMRLEVTERTKRRILWLRADVGTTAAAVHPTEGAAR